MGLFDRFKGKPAEPAAAPTVPPVAPAAARRRAIMIGMDGTPHSLVRRLTGDGTMPNLARLVEAGELKHMTTTIPEISSVAWSSFMTGVNPGKHGVYGFIDLKPQSYKVYFPNATHVKSEALWDVLGRAGKRAVVVNVPSTYPARELSGVMISGFVAISLEKATYPQSLLPRLKEVGYETDVDARKIKESDEALMDNVFSTFEKRRIILEELFDRDDWDLFVGVVTETDRMQHFFWEAIEDPSHKFHARFKEFYARVDGLIGRFADRAGAGDSFFVMSDHGFAPLDKQVYLNHWLRENGYLDWTKEKAETLEDLAPGSRAFAMDPARIYINVKDKYPLGCVEEVDARALRDEIKAKLEALVIDGAPVVARVYEKEATFSGPQLATAPDLCVLPVKGFDFKGAVNKNVLADRDVFTGMHTHDDALFLIKGPAATPGDATIFDVGPTILDALGVERPAAMDGRSLLA